MIPIFSKLVTKKMQTNYDTRKFLYRCRRYGRWFLIYNTVMAFGLYAEIDVKIENDLLSCCYYFCNR